MNAIIDSSYTSIGYLTVCGRFFAHVHSSADSMHVQCSSQVITLHIVFFPVLFEKQATEMFELSPGCLHHVCLAWKVLASRVVALKRLQPLRPWVQALGSDMARNCKTVISLLCHAQWYVRKATEKYIFSLLLACHEVVLVHTYIFIVTATACHRVRKPRTIPS